MSSSPHPQWAASSMGLLLGKSELVFVSYSGCWKVTERPVRECVKGCIWEITFLLTVDPGMWPSFPTVPKITWERDWGVVHQLQKASDKEELRGSSKSLKFPPNLLWESPLTIIQAQSMRSSCDRGGLQLSRKFPALSFYLSFLLLNLYHMAE